MANALAQERSPYLRQHQSNPVDWHPWGDAAFAEAQRLNKPVLLSIGYSACHWCHVMARESFADAQTAALMNANFVNVKVDREERPDVDAIYVRALQAMGRRAGWPLTIFLTPQGRPFWGGTYFPPRERDGLPAFREVLEQISAIYRSDPASVEQKATSLMTELLAEGPRTGGGEPTEAAVLAAAEDLLAHIDGENGGLRGPSKFPYPVLFRFLWNMGRRAGRPDFRAAARLTASRIMDRALYDHVGGGFFRYTVDAQWNVPHFEKMLYDTALLIGLLTEIWRSGEQPACAAVVRRSADWLMREMTLEGGAFACSLDAESDGKEGAYYLWSGHAIDEALGARAAVFKTWFDLGGEANFPEGHVLRLARSRQEASEDVRELDACCDALLRVRARRSPPPRDDKVLADWNGLAISALAVASAVLDEPAWLTAAQRAFAFVVGEMRRGEVLCHSWCEGQPGAAGVLDDYANMSLAALALFEATGDAAYLRHARALTEQCVDRFRDRERGGFYYTAEDASLLPVRMCDARDTATPSGNGVICEVLGRLWCATGEDRYRELAQGVIEALSGDVEKESFQLASLLEARQFLRGATRITLIGRGSDPATRALSGIAHRHAPPDRFVQVVHDTTQLPEQHAAFGRSGALDRAAALVCRHATCSLPITSAADLQRVLGEQDGSGLVV